MPRLVATDLDGTLLHTDGTVTAYTRSVLEELDRRGVPVVFVTGRPIRWMDSLWDAVGGHGLAVCSNGGIVYDVSRHEVRNALTIDPQTVLEVGVRLREGIPGVAFAVEKLGGFGIEDHWVLRTDKAGGSPRGALEAHVDGTVVKLLAQDEQLAPEVFWSEVERLVGDLVTTTWSSTTAMVEMSAQGVTKASTLARLADELGVAQGDVAAFGDMPNDIDMLMWAGHSWAMANAHPSVREIADHEAPPNDEDGVAVTLARIFGIEPPTGNPADAAYVQP